MKGGAGVRPSNGDNENAGQCVDPDARREERQRKERNLFAETEHFLKGRGGRVGGKRTRVASSFFPAFLLAWLVSFTNRGSYPGFFSGPQPTPRQTH